MSDCEIWTGEVDIRGYPKGRPEVDHTAFRLPDERWEKTCGNKLCVNPKHQRIVTHRSWWYAATHPVNDCKVLRLDYPLEVAMERTGGGIQRGDCYARCINTAHRIAVPQGTKPDWCLNEDWDNFQYGSSDKTPEEFIDYLRRHNCWVHPTYLGKGYAASTLKGLVKHKVSNGRGRPRNFYRITDLERLK